MEYVTYILIIFTICLVFLALLRPSLKSAAPDKREDVSASKPKAGRDEPRRQPATNRGTIPTPWGWPGHDDRAVSRSVSGLPAELGATPIRSAPNSLHRWVDRLVSEKRTTEDRDYRMKKDASLRALLEDRYGRASKMQVNGGGGDDGADPGSEIVSPAPPTMRGKGSGDRLAAPQSLRTRRSGREVKTPWGW